MVDEPLASLQNADFLSTLSPEEREELKLKHYVRTGECVVWIEPEGRVRREKAADLYYIRTGRGVFRVSRIDDKIVEV